MTLSRSQTERLGQRLVGSSTPAAEDLSTLHELLVVYGDALAQAVVAVQSRLGITPTARIKNTGTILEKLERYGGSWLKSIQDIAGMRIVGNCDRTGQDALVAHLVETFDGDARAPRVVDRRTKPSHGYRAVHVIVFVRSIPVEIQVRTQLQHEWADLYEKIADTVGRGIRYGEPPDHSLGAAERKQLSESDRMRYELRYELKEVTVERAKIVAEMIDAYEIGEVLEPKDPELRDYRAEVDAALAALTESLNRLTLWMARW